LPSISSSILLSNLHLLFGTSETMPKIQASSALSRFKVIDLSRVRAGPNCVRILTDFGADVIRVEPPPGVDPNEAMFAANRKGGDFQNINRNKRSMTLNLKKPGALEVLMRLVAEADVVVENWRPDVKNKLGLDYESLAKVNPRIILASISGFGQDGRTQHATAGHHSGKRSHPQQRTWQRAHRA
jgi:crotonobetainyl-CoA:carnitine CoA-transferase CaiB-like acyl-CoA transferase